MRKKSKTFAERLLEPQPEPYSGFNRRSEQQAAARKTAEIKERKQSKKGKKP